MEEDKKQETPVEETGEIKEETAEVKEKAAPAGEKKEDKKEKKPGKKKDEEQIKALEGEKAALNDKYLRLAAEYENFRRRSQKEKDALYGDIKADTVAKFLPVYDNLERALKQGTEDEAYRKGVEMIMTQFTATLEKLGVTPIE